MLRKMMARLCNRETVLYVVFGALTTAVNFAGFALLEGPLGWPLLAANTAAWVASVAFAFVTNKLFVFQSRSLRVQVVLREAAAFFVARLLSLALDSAGMWLLVDVLAAHSWAAKLAMNVLVILANYGMSKLFIFRQNGG